MISRQCIGLWKMLIPDYINWISQKWKHIKTVVVHSLTNYLERRSAIEIACVRWSLMELIDDSELSIPVSKLMKKNVKGIKFSTNYHKIIHFIWIKML